MIQGTVGGRLEPVLQLRVRGPGGDVERVDAAIDTGFTGQITLPWEVVARLGLAYDSTITLRLADGTPVETELYRADLEWIGGYLPVVASAVGDVPPVGTRLLAGHQLWAEFAPGGAVTVEPLP